MIHRNFVLMCRFSVIGLLCGLVSAPARAESADAFQFFEEEAKVSSVASLREEKVTDAPGIVTVYSAKDIEDHGYYTISDLAQITPGYNVAEVQGIETLQTRGQAYDFENSKHLVLVDGIPVNFPLSYAAPTQEQLPLYFADRVEFMRGPSSALYGTSAFSGVINIVSKQMKENGSMAETQETFADQDSTKRIMSNVAMKNDMGAAQVDVGYFEKTPSLANVGPVNSPTDLLYDNNKSIFLNSSYKLNQGLFKGLSVGTIYLDYDTGIEESWMGPFTSEENDDHWRTFIPFTKYEHQITSQLAFDGYLRGDFGQEKGVFPLAANTTSTTGGIFNYEKNINGYETKGELKYQIDPKTNAIAGVDYDDRWWANDMASYWHIYTPTPPYFQAENDTLPDHDRTISGYGQLQHDLDFLQGTHLTAGVRSDNGKLGDATYSQWSPRCAVVQDITQEWGIKLLYGTAIRAPSLKEYQRGTEAVTTFLSEGDTADAGAVPTNLEPEKIQSWDASLLYTTAKFSASVTPYYEVITDALVTHFAPGNNNYYVNSPGNTYGRGVETSLQYTPVRVLKLFLNHSYGTTNDENDLPEPDQPINQISTGAHYKLPTSFESSLDLVGKFIDKYSAMAGQADPAGALFVDAKFSTAFFMGTRLDLQVRNLFDRQFQVPMNSIPTVPVQGRTIFVSLNMKFK